MSDLRGIRIRMGYWCSDDTRIVTTRIVTTPVLWAEGGGRIDPNVTKGKTHRYSDNTYTVTTPLFWAGGVYVAQVIYI